MSNKLVRPPFDPSSLSTIKAIGTACRIWLQMEANHYPVALLSGFASWLEAADEEHMWSKLAEPLGAPGIGNAIKHVLDFKHSLPASSGRRPVIQPNSTMDHIAIALLFLNPLGMSLSELYLAMYPDGTSRWNSHEVYSLNTYRTARSRKEGLGFKVEDKGRILPAQARSGFGYAQHQHPTTRKYYFELQVAQHLLHYASPLYTYHARAWGMREYADILESHKRDTCPFFPERLTLEYLRRDNDTRGMGQRHINLLYSDLLTINPPKGDRSKSAMSLPYFELHPEHGFLVRYAHLHHSCCTNYPKAKNYSRYIDVLHALDYECRQHEYTSLINFVESNGLPMLTMIRPTEHDKTIGRAWNDWIDPNTYGINPTPLLTLPDIANIEPIANPSPEPTRGPAWYALQKAREERAIKMSNEPSLDNPNDEGMNEINAALDRIIAGDE